MDYNPLTATGTAVWGLAIAVSALRSCLAGHAALSLLGFGIFMMLNIELWALAPSQFQMTESPFLHFIAWAIALAPLLFLIRQAVQNRRKR